MKGNSVDLLVVVILTLLIQPMIYGVTVEPVRVVLGLSIVLFFPGYVLVSALYPRREQLKGVERVALGLGLSLALVPLLGLGLNFTPWGIRLTPIVVTLSLWILVVAAVAARQRRQVSPEERFDIPWASFVAWIRKPRRMSDLILGLILSGSALAVIGAVAWKVQQPIPGEAFTEFYILGEQQMLQDYPTSLRVGEAQEYNVGVVNHEKDTATYVVRAFMGDMEVGSLGPLTLGNAESWEDQINVTSTTPGEQQKLEFRLFLNPGHEVYRTLHLFVDVRR